MQPKIMAECPQAKRDSDGFLLGHSQEFTASQTIITLCSGWWDPCASSASVWLCCSGHHPGRPS